MFIKWSHIGKDEGGPTRRSNIGKCCLRCADVAGISSRSFVKATWEIMSCDRSDRIRMAARKAWPGGKKEGQRIESVSRTVLPPVLPSCTCMKIVYYLYWVSHIAVRLDKKQITQSYFLFFCTKYLWMNSLEQMVRCAQVIAWQWDVRVNMLLERNWPRLFNVLVPCD